MLTLLALLAIAVIGMLAGCEPGERANDYRDTTLYREPAKPLTALVHFDTLEVTQTKCSGKDRRDRMIMGCAEIAPGPIPCPDGPCEVWLPLPGPRDKGYERLVLHELQHATFGSWHED